MDSTLIKGLGVLEALARSGRPRTVSNIAAELDLTRSNAHRTLQTLVAAGYARQDPDTSGYECSLKLFELANAMPSRSNLSRLAEPVMRMLAASSKETVHLSALDGDDVVYIDKIDSPQPVRAYTTIGGRAPAYCVATGKAILAFQPEIYVERYANRLEAFTPVTAATLDALLAQLRLVRRQGYAINNGEWRASVRGLAAPIFGSAGRVVAAIGISGPADRLSKATLQAMAADVVAAARELSAKLDFSSDSETMRDARRPLHAD